MQADIFKGKSDVVHKICLRKLATTDMTIVSGLNRAISPYGWNRKNTRISPGVQSVSNRNPFEYKLVHFHEAKQH
jgi:hypothetical protein